MLSAATVEPERVHVIHNGIDPTEYRPVEGRDALIRYGIDPERPYLLLRRPDHQQKGIMHLMNAIPAIDLEMQIVLCAGTPDTPEIAPDMEDGAPGPRHGGELCSGCARWSPGRMWSKLNG